MKKCQKCGKDTINSVLFMGHSFYCCPDHYREAIENSSDTKVNVDLLQNILLNAKVKKKLPSGGMPELDPRFLRVWKRE